MNTLPQDCIAKILSLTSPRDVCRSSAVSTIFRSASESDDVWNQFLPSNFPDGFTVPEGLPTKKSLFLSLVKNPILLHDSQLSFSLERTSGKKCYMIAPRALSIVWGNDQKYWQWISLPNTRFPQVAELIFVWWFDITGKINITLLSDDTLYVAYLVFKWNDSPYGFRQPIEASLIFVWWFDITGKINITLLSDDTLYVAYLVFKWNDSPYGFRQPIEASLILDGPEADDVQPSMVSLMQNPGNEEGRCAELRGDGWFEIELGQFLKRRGDMGEIKMSLNETKRPFEKKGLILHGIEIRPVP